MWNMHLQKFSLEKNIDIRRVVQLSERLDTTMKGDDRIESE